MVTYSTSATGPTPRKCAAPCGVDGGLRDRAGWNCSKWRAATGFKSGPTWRSRCRGLAGAARKYSRALWKPWHWSPIATGSRAARSSKFGRGRHPNIIKTLLERSWIPWSVTRRPGRAELLARPGVSRLFQLEETRRPADAGRSSRNRGPARQLTLPGAVRRSAAKPRSGRSDPLDAGEDD